MKKFHSWETVTDIRQDIYENNIWLLIDVEEDVYKALNVLMSSANAINMGTFKHILNKELK